MRGLLLKDFYLLLKHFRMYFLACAFFLIASLSKIQLFLLFYPCMLSTLIPANLQAMDEKSRWDVYCRTLPCRPAATVNAKFLMGLSNQGILMLLFCSAHAIRLLCQDSFTWAAFSLYPTAMLVGFGVSSLFLPFVFYLGMEKGRIAYIMVFVIVGVLSFSIQDFSVVPSGIFSGMLMLGGLLLYALCWYMSILLYARRKLT